MFDITPHHGAESVTAVQMLTAAPVRTSQDRCSMVNQRRSAPNATGPQQAGGWSSQQPRSHGLLKEIEEGGGTRCRTPEFYERTPQMEHLRPVQRGRSIPNFFFNKEVWLRWFRGPTLAPLLFVVPGDPVLLQICFTAPREPQYVPHAHVIHA